MRNIAKMVSIGLLFVVFVSSAMVSANIIVAKETTDSIQNVDTSQEVNYQIIERDGMKYIVSEGEEHQLLIPVDRNQFFPSSVCEGQRVDIELNISVGLNTGCIGSTLAYMCVSLWESDLGADDRVTNDYCTWFPTDGYMTGYIQHTFHDVILSDWIIPDPGNNGEFYVRVNGDCINGNAQSSPEDVALIAGSTPSTPGAPSVTSGCGYIQVVWSSVPGATKYCVYRDGQLKVCIPYTSWQDPNPGTATRCYQISAKNQCGESEKSASRCAKARFTPPPPSRPSASTTTPCANANYTISWSSVSGASEYRLYENGTQVYEGTSRSRTFSHSSGSYSYYVRAGNDCGWSGNSSSRSVTIIPLPGTPTLSVSNPHPDPGCCYTISWATVSGATKYRLYENGLPVYEGPQIPQTFCHWSGTYTYCVRAGNDCGWSGYSGSRSVTISPVIGWMIFIDPPQPCVGEQYTVSWPSYGCATFYELFENGVPVYTGSNRSRTFPPSSSGSFSYSVVACNNECGCSGIIGSRPVTVQQCYSILGQAFYESGRSRIPIPDKEVQLFKNGNLYETDTTNSQGIYSFDHLFKDYYCLKVVPYSQCIYDFNEAFFDTLTDANVVGKNINFIGGSNGEPTDVEAIDAPELPAHFVLSQNYPNPFNPETRIEFDLPRGSFVTFDVYNIVGRRIRNLANERLSAGRKVVTWDGRDDKGQLVSSGIYFYRIVADDFTATKKMILLK